MVTIDQIVTPLYLFVKGFYSASLSLPPENHPAGGSDRPPEAGIGLPAGADQHAHHHSPPVRHVTARGGQVSERRFCSGLHQSEHLGCSNRRRRVASNTQTTAHQDAACTQGTVVWCSSHFLACINSLLTCIPGIDDWVLPCLLLFIGCRGHFCFNTSFCCVNYH